MKITKLSAALSLSIILLAAAAPENEAQAAKVAVLCANGSHPTASFTTLWCDATYVPGQPYSTKSKFRVIVTRSLFPTSAAGTRAAATPLTSSGLIGSIVLTCNNIPSPATIVGTSTQISELGRGDEVVVGSVTGFMVGIIGFMFPPTLCFPRL